MPASLEDSLAVAHQAPAGSHLSTTGETSPCSALSLRGFDSLPGFSFLPVATSFLCVPALSCPASLASYTQYKANVAGTMP